MIVSNSKYAIFLSVFIYVVACSGNRSEEVNTEKNDTTDCHIDSNFSSLDYLIDTIFNFDCRGNFGRRSERQSCHFTELFDDNQKPNIRCSDYNFTWMYNSQNKKNEVKYSFQNAWTSVLTLSCITEQYKIFDKENNKIFFDRKNNLLLCFSHHSMFTRWSKSNASVVYFLNDNLLPVFSIKRSNWVQVKYDSLIFEQYNYDDYLRDDFSGKTIRFKNLSFSGGWDSLSYNVFIKLIDAYRKGEYVTINDIYFPNGWYFRESPLYSDFSTASPFPHKK